MVKKYTPHLYILLAAASYSSLFIFSKFLAQDQIGTFSQVLWRSFFATLGSAIVATVFFKQNLKINLREFKYILVNSIILLLGATTLSLGVYFGTPIAKAAALSYAYPIGVVILSLVLFKSFPDLKHWLGILLALIGVALILEVWEIKDLSQFGLGEIFALSNSIFYAGIIVFGKKLRADTKLNTFTALSYTNLLVIPILFILGWGLSFIGIDLLTPEVRFNFAGSSWLVLIGLGLIGTVAPMGLIYIGINKLKTHVASILLQTEILWIYLAGLILFGQNLTIWGIFGTVVLILAVVLV